MQFLQTGVVRVKKVETVRSSTVSDPSAAHPHTLKVFYGTQTDTSKKFAEQLAKEAVSRGIEVTTADLKDCDPDDTLLHEVGKITLLIDK